MVYVGMGSALPLSLRKVFRPEKQNEGELTCPLLRLQLKIRKLISSSPPLLPLPTPPERPQGTPTFLPCAKNV